ncbi:MAG TPA: tetratricopeptide repeat protein [Anaerolineae bacterium]|nr:tetratricopeptide repeat protein [Anaerolineae bacterium]
MGGKRNVFEKAMKRASSYAWDKQWNKAIVEYKRALAEFPDDLTALVSLGLAYLESHQLEKALSAYQKASQLTPDDPLAWERVADVQERLGRLDEAAETYVTMANIYVERRAMDKAIESWLRATRLAPDHLHAHLSLAEAYTRQGKARAAAGEYLTLARILQKRGQTEKAIQQCRLALGLDPSSTQACAILEALRAGKRVEKVRPPTPAPTAKAGEAEETEEEGNPVDTARQKALMELAEILFEEHPVEEAATDVTAFVEGHRARETAPKLTQGQIDTILGQAIDSQTRGAIDKAITNYSRLVEAGVDQPAIHFSLGLLFQEKMQLDKAIRELALTTRHPEYGLASHFALGECYRAQGKIEDALEHFIEVLKIVDLQTVQGAQADDLIQLYDSLAESYMAKGDRDKTITFLDSLVGFLSGKGWQDKVMEARRRLDSVAGEGVTRSLAEILEVPGSEEVLASMAMAQEYMKRNMLPTAIEEIYRAIEMAPTYLPLHLHLAEVFVRQERFEEAIAKYMTVAEVYHMRGDDRQAIGVYKRVLKLSPMDVNVRARMIDLLVNLGEIDQALEQYMSLADDYYQLAQIDKTLEKYNEALLLASRASDERTWKVRILHEIGDINMQRVDWRRATTAYEEIKALSPDDEQVRMRLLDLYQKQGQMNKALAEIKELVKYCEAKSQPQKALHILKDAVQLSPRQMSLRALLARVYAQQGMKREAIAELDALGELQLEAGLRDAAVQTVKQIIALKPANVEAYRQLLDHIRR